MALLEADDLVHGPIEVLITDEETGMTGARGLNQVYSKEYFIEYGLGR